MTIVALLLFAAGFAAAIRQNRQLRTQLATAHLEADEAHIAVRYHQGCTDAAIRNADIIDEHRVAEIARLEDELAWSRKTTAAVVLHGERRQEPTLRVVGS